MCCEQITGALCVLIPEAWKKSIRPRRNNIID